jgi:mRNA interferase RelE/StbE
VLKSLKKLDKGTAKILLSYIEKHLINSVDPRSSGKALKGEYSGLWRYRIGNYRIIVEIIDDKLIIKLLKLSHRKDIYKQ